MTIEDLDKFSELLSFFLFFEALCCKSEFDLEGRSRH